MRFPWALTDETKLVLPSFRGSFYRETFLVLVDPQRLDWRPSSVGLLSVP